MKYYPLEVVDRITTNETPEQILDMIKKRGFCDEDTTLDEFHDYLFSPLFFTHLYEGKFKKWNIQIMFDKNINKLFFPMYSMRDADVRSTEWKDVLSTSLVVDKWAQFKMVYKIDSDFFHEIKLTENLFTSKDMFDKLPFKCFFIDLTEVENLSDFKGVFVYIVRENDFYGVNIYMVQNRNFTFFTYYSWYKFDEEHTEIEWNSNDLPKSDFMARTFVNENNERLIDTTVDMAHDYDYDPRHDIVVATFQIMSFIAIDASDVQENSNTKQTYKPRKEGSVIKNKFSEVRMWDVGIRYGKAIRVAKQEYKKQIEKQNGSSKSIDRKPVRPHIRRAHWHKYHTGEGRKETKMLWLGPIYVCGTHEIPVTIREIKK